MKGRGEGVQRKFLHLVCVADIKCGEGSSGRSSSSSNYQEGRDALRPIHHYLFR